jgi:multiple sugar transport system permease protein
MSSAKAALAPRLRLGRQGRRVRRGLGAWTINLLLVVGALLMFVPFYWVILGALTPPAHALSVPPEWLPRHVTFDNFRQVFHLVPFGRFALNSFEIAGIATAGSVITSTLAGYAFARLRVPGGRILYALFLASLMVPPHVTVIPTFIVMRHLGLLDTPGSIFLPGLISVFGVFFMRQFFSTVPREIEEAARVDGSGYLTVLRTIMLPIASPALGALTIFVFQLYWNDFFWANIFLFSQDKATLPLGLVRLQGLYGTTSPVVIFAAITMVIVPILILFVFTQRFLTENLARSGIKG